MELRGLRVDLRLEADGELVEVPAGAIKSFRISLRPYGFEAEASFWVDVAQKGDKLFPKWTTTSLMKATLSVERFAKRAGQNLEPLTVTGLVTEKSLLERVNAKAEDRPIGVRRYRVRFADAARVLWTQHRPYQLLADASLHELIDSQNIDGVQLRYAWDALETKHKILCVPCGADRGEASWYDFIMWLVAREHGHFLYDTKKNAYTFAKAKPAEGTPALLPRTQIAGMQVLQPEVERRSARVLNSYATTPKTEEIANEDAVAGVRRDVLILTPIGAQVTERTTLETTRMAPGLPALAVTFRGYPQLTFRTGLLFKFGAAAGEKTWHSGKELRVRDIEIEAEAIEQRIDVNIDHIQADYEGRVAAILEQKDDPRPSLPAHRPPSWPIHVEARIVSEQGEPNDRTWEVTEDPDTSQHYYTINVPVFNKKIVAPFSPELTTGHFFFPAWKNARVLARIEFQAARVTRHLEWAEGARLAADTQGNHLLLGKNAKSETSIKHIYTDGKPVLTITRIHDKDTQRIEISEGSMVIEVKEEEAAAATEEKYDLTIHVENARGELTGQVGSGITELSGGSGAAIASVQDGISNASGQVLGAMEAAEAEVVGTAEAALGELKAARAQVEGDVAQIMGRAEKAKATLNEATE